MIQYSIQERASLITERVEYPGQVKDQREIIYYTDPLCCWSWIFEPHMRRLKNEFKNIFRWRYCMSGLIADWKTYKDPINLVYSPSQMGPVWLHASKVSGMPFKDSLWVDDPPASSYPACIAVKCAGLQSKVAEDNYLYMLRKAVMAEGLNISKKEVLISLAKKMSRRIPSIFNSDLFVTDLESDRSLEVFRKDLQEVQLLGIRRFPSLVIKNRDGKDTLIEGYRPYPVLLNVLKKILVA